MYSYRTEWSAPVGDNRLDDEPAVIREAVAARVEARADAAGEGASMTEGGEERNWVGEEEEEEDEEGGIWLVEGAGCWLVALSGEITAA